jgi:glycosyltransferase involved in cell wall biosynthesis
MRARTEHGYRAALDHLAFARIDAPDHKFRCKLVPFELLCHHLLAQDFKGQATYERAALAGEVTANAMLAWVNLQATYAAKIAWLNEVLGHFSIPPVSLNDNITATPYDRLQSAQRLHTTTDGPKVTVLIAAYDAAATISTSLRSLQEQTWKNLEVIVVDDASPTDDTFAVAKRFAALDPRVRLIKMTTNGGAYCARNCGLDHATGTYVTLHDADDWSHPTKIETQVRYLERTPDAIGCISEQARATSDLQFTRMSGAGTLIIENVSSFLWRRAPVREALGYWDTVRFSADSELIRRAEAVFGSASVKRLRNGPLSFQRDSHTSIMTDDVMGMNGFYYGARKEYFDAQRHFHSSGASLKYDNNPTHRPFPAPTLMHPNRKRPPAERHFEIVLAGDFRVLDDNLSRLTERVRSLRASARRVGLVEMFDYHNQAADNLRCMHSALRAEVDGDAVQVLVYGDKATCDELEIVTPNCDLGDNRYAPTIIVRRRDKEFAPHPSSADELSPAAR